MGKAGHNFRTSVADMKQAEWKPDPEISPQVCQWRIKDRGDGPKRYEFGMIIFGAEIFALNPVTQDVPCCPFLPMAASSEPGYEHSLSSRNSESSTRSEIIFKI